MGIHAKQTNSRRGAAIIEFSLSMVFLVPLVLGVLVFGFRLIRSLEMMQITRDLGHMYIRGINFRNAGPIQNAKTLASGFDLSSTGLSVVILSKIKVIQQVDCDAANSPLPPGNSCVNLNKAAFVEQLTIGNTSSGASVFGTPPLQGDGTVTVKDQGGNSAAAANGFGAAITLKAGEFAYLSEMVNLTPDLNIPGFSGRPQVYARAIF